MNHKLVHQIKVDFNVTPEIKRYVYIYIITGQKGCYLIDSGVDGAEQIVENYLKSIGHEMTDIKAVFLTHAHPDHIGAAWKIKEISGCKIYAGKGEQTWIEDIDLQYKERQIPNFYFLVNKSVELDGVLSDKDTIELEDGITITVLSTPGHSCDELSYVLEENRVVFTGDTIPVKGDIPIWSFIETLSFGRFIELYDLYYGTYGGKNYSSYLGDIKFLRNSAAHNTCLLNSLRKPYQVKINKTMDIMDILKKNKDLTTSYKDKMANPVIHDFVVLLFVYNDILNYPANRKLRAWGMGNVKHLFYEVMPRNKKYFLKNDVLCENYKFICIIIKYIDNLRNGRVI